ncbi:MAG: glycosyltransferase family 4 protein [Prosthecobacter sp.]|jgi:glycosyltransferase involved in cell wall biosynthesis|uniref:glycosyltransferase family 4 protein n=1 Tax=Prosthecobacter sp. TaxID=1965333 RepID=UPI0019E815B6|nr:glycosyltransferase family 4 protein [Prosthecobacter sp.]MBE2286300.1 glycosyltransferase family 4 protein [Prosthecobacter sp.]
MKVAIASRIHPASVGGLAAYQRELASGLQSFCRINGHFLSVQHLQTDKDSSVDSLKWPATELMPQTTWQRQRSLVSRLASRGPLLRFADTLSRMMNHHDTWKSSIADVDVLHFVGTGWDIIGYPLWREAREAGVPFTVWPAVHPQSWGDDAFDVRLYQKADAVFCQSEHERVHLAARGVPVDKLIRCGLPPMCPTNGDGFALRSRLEIADRPTALFLGRRDSGKGYPALLDAWPLVMRQCPEAVLLLAGPGDPDETRLSRISPDSIRDLGCPSEQEKADAYAACDVFCLPSAHESFGIVYVEAWSYGKPVICGTAPASRELVEDDVTGVWADQQPQQLAASLLRLLTNPEHRHRVGLAGLRHQLLHYTTANMVSCHLKAWQISSLN